MALGSLSGSHSFIAYKSNNNNPSSQHMVFTTHHVLLMSMAGIKTLFFLGSELVLITSTLYFFYAYS